MPLSYILKRVQSDAGISSPDLNDEQRLLLIDVVNEAARSLWKSKDFPVALKEVYLRPTNQLTLALPPFIGELRAVRSQRWDDEWQSVDIRARYSAKDWPTKWNKVRKVGESPIAVEITNASPVKSVYSITDAALTINITGETVASNRALDTIVQTAATVVGTQNFTDINRIVKSKVTPYNVIIKDTNDIELATIYADQLEARYLIVDISQYPGIQDCTDGSFIMECLYKPRLPLMINDEDEFPLIGREYDDLIVLKTKQLLAEDQIGQEQRAILMNEKAKIELDEIVNDKTQEEQKKISVTRNKLLGLFRGYPRYRDSRDYRGYY